MTVLKWDDKDPDAVKDYAIDWSAILATGETILTSTWTVNSVDLEKESSPASLISGAICTVWLSGGVAGATYRITNHITTSRGMEDERTVVLEVKEL